MYKNEVNWIVLGFAFATALVAATWLENCLAGGTIFLGILTYNKIING